MSGENEIEIRRLMQQIQHELTELNSSTITQIAGDIKRSDFMDLARSISILRARYLKSVLDIAHADESHLTNKLCHDVSEARQAFEEAVTAFDQLKHALQRGYFNLIDD